MALPPGPRVPATVATAQFARRPLDTLLRWHRRYGDAFTVRFLVFGTGVYVADPAEIRKMFTGDQSDLKAGEANSPFSPILGRVLGAGPRRPRAHATAKAPLAAVPRVGRPLRSGKSSARSRTPRSRSWREGDEFPLRERMRALTFDVICRRCSA